MCDELQTGVWGLKAMVSHSEREKGIHCWCPPSPSNCPGLHPQMLPQTTNDEDGCGCFLLVHPPTWSSSQISDALGNGE
jgi:hypothetical protein